MPNRSNSFRAAEAGGDFDLDEIDAGQIIALGAGHVNGGARDGGIGSRNVIVPVGGMSSKLKKAISVPVEVGTEIFPGPTPEAESALSSPRTCILIK